MWRRRYMGWPTVSDSLVHGKAALMKESLFEKSNLIYPASAPVFFFHSNQAGIDWWHEVCTQTNLPYVHLSFTIWHLKLRFSICIWNILSAESIGINQFPLLLKCFKCDLLMSTKVDRVTLEVLVFVSSAIGWPRKIWPGKMDVWETIMSISQSDCWSIWPS